MSPSSTASTARATSHADLEIVAGRFKALGEPARLQILDCVRQRERTVTDIVDATGLGQANVSKHLQVLYAAGFVTRRKEGVCTYYGADARVPGLCQMVCDGPTSRF